MAKKILIITGDGGESYETWFAVHRFQEAGYEAHVAAPSKRRLHLVMHDFEPGWDTYKESPGYAIEADLSFADVKVADYEGVLAIGGRAPEPIPDVGADGKSQGFRRDPTGKTLTTELSAEGEAQLDDIAKATGGAIVRAERGDTGIDEVARGLKKMMREELAERVEIAFDEEYFWPLGLAVLLLVIEGLVAENWLAVLPLASTDAGALVAAAVALRPIAHNHLDRLADLLTAVIDRRSAVGSGLGLAIAKQRVRAEGQPELRLHSQPARPRRGTPRGSAPRPARRVATRLRHHGITGSPVARCCSCAGR